MRDRYFSHRDFSRCALSICLAAALLSACGSGGASVPLGSGANNAMRSASLSSGSKTFEYTGKKQSFIVPTGVTQLEVIVRGATGGDSGVRGSPSFIASGFGGRVDATIPVQSGEKLYVFVGGRNAHATGGFNGGGSGTSGGDGGGGASDIRAGGDALQDRIIVAAGGGGSGGQLLYTYGWGGDGGGYRGRPGGGGLDYCGLNGQGGGGGTQHKGGAGGAGGKAPPSGTGGKPGTNGAAGSGGDGGVSNGGGGGGGGGGGYHGGGGGGGGASSYSSGCGSFEDQFGGGGGGGSSYIEPGATHRRIWTGYKRARSDGLVVISWN